MGVEWEEYRPVVGEPYSPGTQYKSVYDSPENWTDDPMIWPHEARHDSLLYRRPKQSTTAPEVQRLKAAVKELSQIVKDLVYFGIDHEGLSSRLDSVLSDLL